MSILECKGLSKHFGAVQALENVDLAGKTIIPFCTSNSSGIGSSATNLQKVTGEDVKWEKGGRVKKGDNAEAIAEWIKSIIQN